MNGGGMSDITINDDSHLPECEMAGPICSGNVGGHRGFMFCLHCHRRCICGALRACEQRVHNREAMKRIEATERGLSEGIREGRNKTVSEMKMQLVQRFWDGRSAGLDAARGAVAGMAYRYAWSDVEVSTYSEGVVDALAAIDALREGQR